MIHRDICFLYTDLHYFAETRTSKERAAVVISRSPSIGHRESSLSHQKLAVNREVAWYELYRIVMRSRSRLLIVEEVG